MLDGDLRRFALQRGRSGQGVEHLERSERLEQLELPDRGHVTEEPHDLLRDLRVIAGAFVLPILAIVAIGFFNVDSRVQALVWAAALGVMATACALNARRCGRLHCYFTAPFFYIMAAVALLLGFGPLGRSYAAWNVLGIVLVVGAITLTWLPERFFGKYRRRETPP